jgi:cell pole-organizing protein PopZ
MSTANPLSQSQHPSLESEQRAHEPSMEEILASIRRIIADDDALPLMRRPSLVTREPAAVATERLSDVPRHPAGAEPAAPPVHLVAVPSAESDLAEPVEATPAMAVPSDPFAPRGEEYVGNDGAADAHELRPSIREDLPEEEHASGVTASEPETRARVSPAFARDREEREGAPLISPSTDASVASSFQSLATSMFLRDSDMIARTAREMLRPMLKQWLDDNLPVMVERLVRAEIERVARGGR